MAFSSTTMCKRKRGNILPMTISQATSLMEEFHFDLGALKASLTEMGLNASFSNVKYMDIVPFIGLDPLRNFNDATLLDLRHTVVDMDVLLTQYGIPQCHPTEEAGSRFLTPIFNRLVAPLAVLSRTRQSHSLMAALQQEEVSSIILRHSAAS
ncbi:hypothetical protein BJY52DRAFT_1243348 [Lactarius psammicola]|nr:hypothetical protein BJY52DRAFT_1243348 [Lactarius psammicola]